MQYKLKHTATLFDTVMEIYKGVSRQKAKQIITHSDFKVNGNKIDRHPKQILQEGSELEIISVEKKQNENPIPSGRNPVAVYFEDTHLIVVLKPAGILSCGNREMEINNSYHKLLESFLQVRDGRRTRLWVIHRLDREVEGLLIFSKSESMQQQMKDNWQQVTKKYLAITEKKPEPASGIIENWLTDTPSHKVYAHAAEVPGSKFAKTEYTWVKEMKPYHLVEVKLHTGRKNQIRVQLAGIGCPVVGDRKYGADSRVVRQIRLAAFMLEFEHPVTGRLVSVQYKPARRFFEPSQTDDEKYRVV